MTQHIPVITIDGPSGAGKGTISQMLAKRLGWHLLDSGALYRVLASEALRQQVPLQDARALAKLAHNVDICFMSKDAREPVRVYLNHADMTDEVRAEAMGEVASKISAFPEVRKALLDLQHNFRQMPGLVADGRDMGTVVFVDAAVKVYLTANPETRVKRRRTQLLAQGIDARLVSLTDELAARDARDSDRAISPMKPAEDAITVDTTGLSIEAVFDRVGQIVQQRVDHQGE